MTRINRDRRAALMLALMSLALGACARHERQVLLPGGDDRRGRELIDRYGCGTCHVVPGTGSARGQVGPPLDGIAHRSYIGGTLPNTPDNMVLFIRQPQKVRPGSAMPDLGIPEHEARDVAAYLYTLK
ncbi:MAG: di-heme cytochrome c [Betaproteobacteria bacterium]|nr:di-heme cytochrome c [Betaproteobacteria bacterium]